MEGPSGGGAGHRAVEARTIGQPEADGQPAVPRNNHTSTTPEAYFASCPKPRAHPVPQSHGTVFARSPRREREQGGYDTRSGDWVDVQVPPPSLFRSLSFPSSGRSRGIRAVRGGLPMTRVRTDPAFAPRTDEVTKMPIHSTGIFVDRTLRHAVLGRLAPPTSPGPMRRAPECAPAMRSGRPSRCSPPPVSGHHGNSGEGVDVHVAVDGDIHSRSGPRLL
jgi:hypothetical protein